MDSFASLGDFLRRGLAATARGPIALIFAEDAVGLARTLQHHLDLGFRHIVLFTDTGIAPPEGLDAAPVSLVPVTDTRAEAMARTVTEVQGALPEGTWVYWGYNAEFLFFPFCETRSVGEMLTFHAEERRSAMLGFTVDFYGPEADGTRVPEADALIDRIGYYALARPGEEGPKERQLDFFGGLRWRFEEHVPKAARRIDRIPLFRSTKDLILHPDATLSEPERNTYQCPWHHNLTCAVVSFRAAKALALNPGSRHAIGSFRWHNSVPFAWSSQQLMDLGLMEPGQWF